MPLSVNAMKGARRGAAWVLLDYGPHLRQELLGIDILFSQPVISCIALYLVLSVALMYNSLPFSIVMYQIHCHSL